MPRLREGVERMSRVGPFAGFWGSMICWVGFHRVEFSYGYVTHLDKSMPDDYYGTRFCGRCGLVLSGSPASQTAPGGTNGK